MLIYDFEIQGLIMEQFISEVESVEGSTCIVGGKAFNY